MDLHHKQVLDLVGHVYETAVTPTHWPVVLEKLAALTRSKSAIFVAHDSEYKKMSAVYAYGLPRLLQGYLNSPLGALDPGLKVMKTQPQGKAVNMYRLDDPMVPRVFQAIVRRFTDRFYFAGINCFNDDVWHVGIGLHRSREEGEFEPETLEFIDDLVPHFQRALRIQREFTRLQIRQQMIQAELDRHIMGLILLGENGEVIYRNPMARKILACHGAIALRGNTVRAHRREENELLQQALQPPW